MLISRLLKNVADNLESIISVVNVRLDPEKNKYFLNWGRSFPFLEGLLQFPRGEVFL